jgi:hypothetical protein
MRLFKDVRQWIHKNFLSKNKFIFIFKMSLSKEDEKMEETTEEAEEEGVVIPTVGQGDWYFRPAPFHRPPPDGLISSKILPDGSNTLRFTTLASSETLYLPDEEEVQERVRQTGERTFHVYSGTCGPTWKE